MGSQVVRTLLEAGWDVVVLDKLTYAGKRVFLEGLSHRFIEGDVCDMATAESAVEGVNAIVHMAAESHVERAITGPDAFVQTNVVGTRVMLDAACRAGVARFIHVSTDEVFGAAGPTETFGVNARLRPGNAYAASKMGAEAMVHAWRHTHGYPATIVRCTNNYGPRQHPEKAIPCWSLAAIAGGPVPVQGQGTAVRDWLHVTDFARGIVASLERWKDAAVWHFAGQQHRPNRVVASTIAELCGVSELSFGPERLGQDARYSLDDASTRTELDWEPQVSLEEGLSDAIEWYRVHGDLWDD